MMLKQTDFKSNLRMWSDTVSFNSLDGSMPLPADVSYDKGDFTRAPNGQQTKRRMDRHYYSSQSSKSSDVDQLGEWVRAVLQNIQQWSLASAITTGEIEAVLWIASLGGPLNEPLTLDPAILTEAQEIGLTLMFEDYAHSDENGAPLRTYLT